MCCAFCVSVSWSFWSSSYFILLLIAFLLFFFFLFSSDIFFWDFVVVVVGGSKRYIYTYISVLAASPDNLLLAFFFLFLYTIFLYISFYDIPYESKASLTEKKVFIFISSSIPALLSRLFHLTFVGNNIYVVFLFHLFCYNNNNSNKNVWKRYSSRNFEWKIFKDKTTKIC